jgi:hypothetical protein
MPSVTQIGNNYVNFDQNTGISYNSEDNTINFSTVGSTRLTISNTTITADLPFTSNNDYAIAYSVGPQSIPNGIGTLITTYWETSPVISESTNPLTWTSAGGKFTVGKPGLYLLGYSVLFTSDTSPTTSDLGRYAYFVLNQDQINQVQINCVAAPNAGIFCGVNNTILLNLVQGNTIQVYARQFSGINLDLYSYSTAYRGCFYVYKVG